MARRTVENFNGFIPARSTATTTSKKSTVPPRAPAPGRSRPSAPVKGNRNLPNTGSTKSSKAALPAKKIEQQNSHSIPKVEKNLRYNNAPGKKASDKIKNVSEQVKIQQNVTKNESKTDKKTTEDNSNLDSSSNISNEEEYEDDFEDYESDFESDSSTKSIPVILTPQQVVVDQPNSDNVVVNFPLYVEEKVEPFLDEKFEVNLLEQTIEIGLKNFQTAEKRKREQEVKEKVKTRGTALMEMIKLDTVSYSLLDIPATPYEQYIKIYGRSNTTQVQTQTHDENAEKEIQTNEIESCDKWTQRPIILENELDCSSAEYQRAKLGVGGNESDDRPRLMSIATVMDSDRVCAVGRIMLAILDQQAMERAEQRLIANNFDLDFSNGHLRPTLCNVKFFDGSSVTTLEFARITCRTECLVTIHEITKSHYHYDALCIWCISNMENPDYILKCPDRVTSFCVLPKSTSGFVAAAHANGSICVWDLKESRLHHHQIDNLLCPLRSPSFNTALSVDQGHTSKIIGLSAVTYTNTGATDDEFPDELCSLDEDFVLNVWSVVDSQIPELLEHQSPGTAPWSSVRLTKMQIIEANKYIPRYLFDGAVATCMCLNNNQEAFIGTNSGLVFRCNLGELKLWPSYYTYEDTCEHFSINWLDICPFDSNYFLAGCSNSKVILYRADRQESLGRFFTSPNVPKSSAPLVKVQWCIEYPGIVFGLDSLSSVHVWDVCDDITGPIMTVPFRGKTVTSMSLTLTRTNRNCYIGLAFSDGKVELHQINMKKRKAVENEDNNSSDSLARVLANL